MVLPGHTRGARKLDTRAERAGWIPRSKQISTTVRMLTPQVVAGPGAKVRLDCSAAQASTEPASAERRLPLTEPDRDMSAVKLVKWCR